MILLLSPYSHESAIVRRQRFLDARDAVTYLLA